MVSGRVVDLVLVLNIDGTAGLDTALEVEDPDRSKELRAQLAGSFHVGPQLGGASHGNEFRQVRRENDLGTLAAAQGLISLLDVEELSGLHVHGVHAEEREHIVSAIRLRGAGVLKHPGNCEISRPIGADLLKLGMNESRDAILDLLHPKDLSDGEQVNQRFEGEVGANGDGLAGGQRQLVQVDECGCDALDQQTIEETLGIKAVSEDDGVHRVEKSGEILQQLPSAGKLGQASVSMEDERDLRTSKADQLVIVPGAEHVSRRGQVGKLRQSAVFKGQRESITYIAVDGADLRESVGQALISRKAGTLLLMTGLVLSVADGLIWVPLIRANPIVVAVVGSVAHEARDRLVAVFIVIVSHDACDGTSVSFHLIVRPSLDGIAYHSRWLIRPRSGPRAEPWPHPGWWPGLQRYQSQLSSHSRTKSSLDCLPASVAGPTVWSSMLIAPSLATTSSTGIEVLDETLGPPLQCFIMEGI